VRNKRLTCLVKIFKGASFLYFFSLKKPRGAKTHFWGRKKKKNLKNEAFSLKYIFSNVIPNMLLAND
jgi:hypothetical protein